jgi:hypothetical protein
MAKSISVKRKKAGRPATGTEPLYGVRISDPLMKQIMEWAKAQGATRSEAIRRLVEIGLAVRDDRARGPGRSLDLGQMAKIAPGPSKTRRRARASELAAEVIDKIGDPAASTDERDERQRRLTKGPPEFRKHRVDLPKAKRK